MNHLKASSLVLLLASRSYQTSTSATQKNLPTYCDPRPLECVTDEYQPVCGYLSNCEADVCTKTISNNCFACLDPNISAYIEGECEEKRTLCDPQNRPEVCDDYYDPVCSIVQDGDQSYYKTAGNSCEACSASGVEYHLPGECPKTSVQNERKVCDVNNRPNGCYDVYQPVCAKLLDCVSTDGPCEKTMPNDCDACADPTVESYVEGECLPEEYNEEQEQKPDDPVENKKEFCTVRSEICPPVFMPVCAYEADCTGDSCRRTAGSGCDACFDPKIEYYISGECPEEPDDKKIFCTVRSDICPAVFMPVCAYKADCTGDSCRRTAGSGCDACFDPKIEYYISGECPDEPKKGERKFCDPNNRPNGCYDIYQPVCAKILDFVSSDGSFEKTMPNDCDACADPIIESYVEGECVPREQELEEKNSQDVDELKDAKVELEKSGSQVTLCAYLSLVMALFYGLLI